MDFLTIRMLDFSKPFIASPPRAGEGIHTVGEGNEMGNDCGDAAAK